MKNMRQHPDEYYDRQYNIRAMLPEYPYIFTRWTQESARIRRTTLGLFDLAYGPAKGERLDFFPTRDNNAPLLVFIHGGWWRSLDKSTFSFIAPAYTHAGINVALTNYTLAPTATLEEIVMQQLHALAWLYRNAEKYNADPNRIIVAGHAAGAHLAALMMAAVWPIFALDLPLDLVKGAVLLSGIFDLEGIRRAEFINTDLKLTEGRVDLLSPVWMPQTHRAPFVTAVGALESDEFKRQSKSIGKAWKKNLASGIVIPDADHLTVCDAFAAPNQPLFNATIDLISSIH